MGRKKQKNFKNGFSVPSKSPEEIKLLGLVDNLLRLTTATAPSNVNKALELQNEIVQIINELQLLERDRDLIIPPDSRCDGATINKFLNWLTENGAEFDGIKIANFPGYELGLQAEKDINESSLIISVPRKLMLTIEAAQDTILGNLIQKDALLNNMPNVALTLFLIFEKLKGDSFWKPYINILPGSYSTVLYFGADELEELKGSPVLEVALKQIRNICRQYAYFHKVVWTSDDPACKIIRKHFTFNLYRWAASTVMTRQNTVPSSDGTHYINALIPLWDLCNHTNGSITTDYNPEKNRSECFALKDFKIGDQIFIFYGARNNSDLLIHNGFVYEDNAHDGYLLRLGISKSDPLQEKRAQLLEKLSLKVHNDFWLRKGSAPVDGDLIAFLRVFNMDEGQLQSWLTSDKSYDLKHLECSLDTNLENKCWRFLQTRIGLLLSSYKNALEEDLRLINDPLVPENRKICIRMRAIEKRILNDVLSFAEQRVHN